MRWRIFLLAFSLAVSQTLNLHAQLILGKDDNKAKMYEEVQRLYKLASDNNIDPALLRFIDNMTKQLEKAKDAASQIKTEAEKVPTTFTAGKYKIKDMKKLRAKKCSLEKMSPKDLKAKLAKGQLEFTKPFIVTNATALFPDWDEMRRHWSAQRIQKDPYLEKEFQLDYYPPDQARARLVGNHVEMIDPIKISFSRYLVLCHHGTPAAPKIPGQATEHCEQSVPATHMTQTEEELKIFNIFPQLNNTFHHTDAFRQRFSKAGKEAITEMLGRKKAASWFAENEASNFRAFTFGPSGSGDKLHAEQGLPFYDILVHGARRWLIIGEEELQRVAEKAREALEFQQTSAYMFFEEKLPELKEEFGLKKYYECTQDAGDVIFVPPGWFRVSLSIADSISFHEQMLHDARIITAITNQRVWFPRIQTFALGFCYEPDEIVKKLGSLGSPKHDEMIVREFKKQQPATYIESILTVLVRCGGHMALQLERPDLDISNSVCTQEAWDACRGMLKKKLAEAKKDVSLDWIDFRAPRDEL